MPFCVIRQCFWLTLQAASQIGSFLGPVLGGVVADEAGFRYAQTVQVMPLAHIAFQVVLDISAKLLHAAGTCVGVKAA